MRVSLFSPVFLMAVLAVNPASAWQIGPRIVIGDGNACIGGACIGKDGVKLPTVDDLIDSAINSGPLTLLSDADKDNIREAIKTTGVVSTIVSNPVTGIVIAHIIYGDGKQQDIPIPTQNIPPTGKNWSLLATCIVQQKDIITAMFNNDPTNIDKVADGDTINLTAPFCKEYTENSVTSVRIKMTGRSDYPDVSPPRYRHYIVGVPMQN